MLAAVPNPSAMPNGSLLKIARLDTRRVSLCSIIARWEYVIGIEPKDNVDGIRRGLFGGQRYAGGIAVKRTEF